jgi:hypothetical protein
MGLSERRVRKLRLRAAEESLVHRGAILLADALRIATVPGNDRGGLVVVRSLEVGTIRTCHSSASLALALEERLARLIRAAVSPDDPWADRSEAVRFADEIEPHLALAIRLARGEEPEGWFWPLAVRGWRRGLGLEEGLRAVLRGALAAPGGLSRLAILIGQLHARRLLDRALTAVRDSDAVFFLSGYADGHAETVTPPGLPAIWRPVLQRWVAHWGPADARSLWLGATALLAEHPGRAHDPRLVAAAKAMVAMLHGSRALFDRTPPEGATSQGPSIAKTVGGEATSKSHAVTNPAPHPGSRILPETLVPPRAASGSQAALGVLATPGRAADDPGTRDREFESIDSVLEDGESDAHCLPWDQARPTALAGLFFQITLLEMLGFSTWIQDHPDAITAGLPTRLIRHVGQRLVIPGDDPALAVLSLHDESAAQEFDFVAPPLWRSLVCAEGPLTLSRTGDRKCLSDRTGRLVLARWRGAIPASVREYVGKRAVRRFRCPFLSGQAADLTSIGWLTAMRRLCRARAGIGLRTLVRRPGAVLATRTHWDILLFPDQVDLRVRRTGLDINPGWVPWLGRIVQFHYDYGATGNEH